MSWGYDKTEWVSRGMRAKEEGRRTGRRKGSRKGETRDTEPDAPPVSPRQCTGNHTHGWRQQQ
jgi:hypothetical protein